MDSTTHSSPSLSSIILRRPFLSVAAIFILGVFAHTQLSPRPLLYLVLSTTLLLLSCLLRSLPPTADLLLAASMFLAGTITAQLESYYFPAHHIAYFTSDQPRLARLELQITQPPRILTSSQPAPRPSPPRQVAQAEVLRILTTTGWQAATGTITIQVDQPLRDLAIAQRIIALGLLSRPIPAANPGQFDWSSYYRNQRILGALHIRQSRTIQILASPGPGLLDSLRQSVRRSLEDGFLPSQSLDHALLRALVLGDSDPQLRDVQDDFVRTGTSHHLAISGMHIAVLGGLVLGLCRLLLLPPRLSVAVSLLLVILYGLLALPSPPVVRSVLLCIACGIGIVSRRSVDGIQLLALSVFAMLIYHPLDLYSPGFQLSFGTVLGLMLFGRPTLAYLTTPNIHEQVAASVRKPTLLQSLLSSLRHHLLEASIIGVIAWLVSAPLIAFHFNQLNPYAIPASLLLAVPVFLALIGGFLKIILTLLLPPFAPYFADLAALPISLMRHMVDLLAQIPHSDAPFVRPPVWTILLFYLLLALPLLRVFVSSRLRVWLRLSPVLAILLVLCLPLLLGSSSTRPGDLRLTLLSVGTGQCAVIELPSGKIILIDAGSASFSDLSRRTLTPYLKSIGHSRIDGLFISHANYDHFSAVADAIVSHNIQRIYVSPLFQSHAATDPPATALLKAIASQNLSPQILSVGQKLRLDPEITLEVLWPPANYRLVANDSSLVLRLTCHGRSILFPGDIETLAEMELLVNPVQLRSDVLIAPHHGSAVSTTAKFLAAVDPELILASNSPKLTSKQHQFNTIAAPRHVYRTDEHGAITLIIRRTGQLELATFLPDRSAARPRQ